MDNNRKSIKLYEPAGETDTPPAATSAPGSSKPAKRLRMTIMNRLLVTYFIAILVPAAALAAVSYNVTRTRLTGEAQSKTVSSLNSARNIYSDIESEIRLAIDFSAINDAVWRGIEDENLLMLENTLQFTYENSPLDFLNVTDADGRVIIRYSNSGESGDIVLNDPLVKKTLEESRAVSGTYIAPIELMRKEIDMKHERYDTIAERAEIDIIRSKKAAPSEKQRLDGAMVIGAARPVLGPYGDVIGIVYGGHVINRNHAIADHIKDTIFKDLDESGSVTIFQNDVRISTNVMTDSGVRSTGTRVQAEVAGSVMKRGETWKGRTFVLDSWSIAAYEPVMDINSQIIGMLYVGISEDRYAAMAVDSTKTVMAVALACLILIGTPVFFITAKSVSGRLSKLSGATDSVARGDLTVGIDMEGNDEISDLSAAFNTMVENLREMTGQVRAGVSMLKSSSESIMGYSQDHAARISQQSAAVSEISSTVEELSASSRQIAASADSIASLSERTLAGAKSGGKAVIETENGVEEIKSKARESADSVMEMGEKSQEIGNVINIINEITEKTKLIAFNAAIEAAGAGEAGRRFSIVAVEVRNLAENVVESTDEIKTIIQEIRESTQSSVMASDAGVRKVEKGLELARNARATLDRIVDLMNECYEAASQISKATQQQETASEQVVNAVREISKMTGDSLKGAEQGREASEQLNQLAQKLEGLVERFKV